MPTKHIIKELSCKDYTLKDLTDVILNVDAYKSFVPHCTKSNIIESNQNNLVGEIEISFSVFKVCYISKIDFKIEENRVAIEVREFGNKMFKHLLNTWNLSIKEDKIIIDFFVDFEIKKMLLNTIATASLPLISDLILNSFLKRVKELSSINA